jgi:AcrR family transcriptional regulator
VARPEKFTSEDILDAAVQVVAERGPAAATVAAIAEQIGAPTGSIYHRFASRDLLLARVWIRTVRSAQAGFLDALDADDVDDAANQAALHIPRWSRDNLSLAQALLLHRREDLVERWPDELGDELRILNDDIRAALTAYAKRRYGRRWSRHLNRVMFALVDLPYGAVRRYLVAGEPPPLEVDDFVSSGCACVLEVPR